MKKEIKDKEDVKRKQLTSNILNKVILRIDFLRIIKIEDLVSEVQEYLNNENFNLTNDEFINTVEFAINDPDISAMNGFNVKKNIKRQKVYNFKNSNNTCLAITESCIIFNIDCKNRYNLEEYIDVFCNIIIKAQNKFDFIKFIRVGLRKINNIICVPENLYDCFDENFFKNITIDKEHKKNIKYMKRTSLDNFAYSKYLFNVSKVVQEGIFNDNENTDIKAVNAILDIDGYLKDNKLLEDFKDTESIKDVILNINDDIFNIFKSMLTISFINDLIKGDSNKIKWGLNKNDKI